MKKSSGVMKALAPFIVLILFFAAWYFAVRLFGIERWILPDPLAILQALFTSFPNEILPHFWITLREIAIGFVIGSLVGVVLAALVSQFKILDMAFSPYVTMLVTVPLIVLVPLMMMWLGFGMEAKIAAVIIQTFPIVMLNSATGFMQADPLKLELMTVMGASRTQTFFNVTFPSALPHVFTGLRLGAIFATIAALSTEFVGGNQGLGSKIVSYTSFIQTEKAFASILCVGILGILLYSAVTFAERKVLKHVN